MGVKKQLRRPRGRGRLPPWARPPPSWAPRDSPPIDFCSSIFYIFHKKTPLIFGAFRELLFLHKNNTMAILLKTTSARVSSIQIMQVRVQTRAKVFGKVDTTETYRCGE